MINTIKNLFSGILSFFIGLLGGKKSKENNTKAEAAEKPAAIKALTGLLGGKKSQENNNSTEAAEKPAAIKALTGLLGGKKSQENNNSTEAVEKPAANAKNRKRSGYFMELDEADEKKPVEANQLAKAAAGKTSEPAATQPAKTQLVQTAQGVKAEPVNPTKSPVASANTQKQTETTFAPKYLMPSASSNSRRRPVPSMNPFLDMARQVKTPG